MRTKQASAGLTFMQTAKASMPRTLGDRERIFAMCRLMAEAVRCRFQFDKDDGPELRRLGIETCVGVFRPLDYYAMACCAGGTYARMWEHQHKMAPWVAAKAVIREPEYGGSTTLTVVEHSRVAENLGVLLPQTFSEPDDTLATVNGDQLWWVTAMDADSVTVCRYRIEAEQVKYRYEHFKRNGAPAKRRKLTRDEWAQWNPKATPLKKAA